MALDADEIVVGSNGRIYVAPVGTAIPTDIATAWGAGWIDLGYANEDGVTISKSRTMEQVPAWQSFFPLRRMVTAEDFTVSFNLLQWGNDSVILAFGGGTITATAGPPAHYLYTPPDPGTLDERAVGVEWQDGTKIYRLTMAKAMVTETVETQMQKAGAAELPITLGVMGEAGVSPFLIRSNDPAWAA